MKKICLCLFAACALLCAVGCQKEKDEEKVTAWASANELPGEFSVGNGAKVHFSRGNLHYVGNGNWGFERNQYDTYSDWNGAHVHLFNWASDPEEAAAEEIMERGEGHYTFFANDKSVMGSEWTALSADQWEFLLHARPDAAKKTGFATVCGARGLVILPDNFTDPNVNNRAFAPVLNEDMDVNKYDSFDDWDLMESAGAVFLPAAGWRYYEAELYRTPIIEEPANYGLYWTSTAIDDHQARYIEFNYRSDQICLNTGNRDLGYSVRLVKF